MGVKYFYRKPIVRLALILTLVVSPFFLKPAIDRLRETKDKTEFETVAKDQNAEKIQALRANFDKQFQEISKIKDKNLMSEAQYDLVTLQIKTGFFSDALSNISKIDDSYTGCITLCDVASALATIGEINDARRVFEKAGALASKIIDKSWHSQDDAKYCKATSEAKARLFADACETASEINDNSSQGRAQYYIAIEQAKIGLFVDAYKITSKITSVYWRYQAFCNIAGLQAKTGFVDDAKKTFAKAKESALTIENVYRRCLPLCDIAVTEAKAGLSDDAKITFKKAKSSALKIENLYGRCLALCDIATALAKAGLMDDAKTMFELTDRYSSKINDKNSRLDAQKIIKKSKQKISLN